VSLVTGKKWRNSLLIEQFCHWLDGGPLWLPTSRTTSSSWRRYSRPLKVHGSASLSKCRNFSNPFERALQLHTTVRCKIRLIMADLIFHCKRLAATLLKLA